MQHASKQVNFYMHRRQKMRKQLINSEKSKNQPIKATFRSKLTLAHTPLFDQPVLRHPVSRRSNPYHSQLD